ncbi:MAG: tRNA pseudouridine(13) synthase TruD [SAR324 cluster bacterium]|nr:tRNA pseudouridine(13) synthase TruD [SAR324 cluster bacterium]
MNAQPSLPFATAQWPGCAGTLRTVPEDFQVEELPAYPASGSGEHLLVQVEKRGISTWEAILRLSRVLGLPRQAAGHAGLKDAFAVARQWLSFQTPANPSPAELERSGLKILTVDRHRNKLRPGHLRGNRFRIVIRGGEQPAGFAELAEKLLREGFPNYFGPQRVGANGRNAEAGKELLRAGFPAPNRLNRNRFLTNAYQASLFNSLLAKRLAETGSLAEMLPGDLAVLHASRGFFSVTEEDLEAARNRAAVGEISPSAPLFGYKVPLAQGLPGQWEQALLAAEGLSLADFRQKGKRLSPKGERRPVRAFPVGLEWECTEVDGLPSIIARFTLGPGVYATSLLRELMKNDPDAPGFSEPLPSTDPPHPDGP